MSNDTAPISDPLSPSDGFIFFELGSALIQEAVGIVFETFCMSIYMVVFGLALHSIRRKGIRSLSSLAMLGVVLYLFAASFTLWALNVAHWFLSARGFLLPGDDTTSLLDRAVESNNMSTPLGVPEEALFMFNLIIGDSVVIWRVWAICRTRRKRWVVTIPCFFLLISLIFIIIDLTCLTGGGFAESSSVAGTNAVCNNAELISWAVSFGTNLSCTILIGIEAWKHRRLMRSLDLPSPGRGRSPCFAVDRLLSLLLESGCIYCLFWLTQVILFVPVSWFNYTIYLYNILGALGDQISGLYPTLIIVIVNYHYTIWDEPGSAQTKGFNSYTGGNIGTGSASMRSPVVAGNTSTIRWNHRADDHESGEDSEAAEMDVFGGAGRESKHPIVN
ncbi:hypothetical protein HMN09_00133800 [Mycena chlorophos]|uniref:Uncharacterized protein n=1 Tax=Mycena chlorophos TaxID=658473 RepID=A0A8H6TPN3_MYCCL|nr:hypothetical protein HMN09_00133800 [Mycena chlorophos]